jgi:hypothetical protein
MLELVFYLFVILLLFVPLRTLQTRSPSNQSTNTTMRRGPNRLGRRGFFPPGQNQQPSRSLPDEEEEPESLEYEPTIREVLVVKEQLQRKSSLPIELIEAILDDAEYWPHTSTSITGRKTILAGKETEESQFLVGPPSLFTTT